MKQKYERWYRVNSIPRETELGRERTNARDKCRM